MRANETYWVLKEPDGYMRPRVYVSKRTAENYIKSRRSSVRLATTASVVLLETAEYDRLKDIEFRYESCSK